VNKNTFSLAAWGAKTPSYRTFVIETHPKQISPEDVAVFTAQINFNASEKPQPKAIDKVGQWLLNLVFNFVMGRFCQVEETESKQ
jgi:hypothetical protein